jgi:proteasome assembly chaperone (PAC2) family protein
MKNLIKLSKDPRPKACDLIASWPGIGNVSLIVSQYLRDKLNAEEIGAIEPFNFFEPIGVMVKNNIIEAPQFPESKLYYWKNAEYEKDLLLFIGDEQPSVKGYDMANAVLDICEKLKVKRVFTLAAAIAKIHHTEMPRVWGAATNQKLIDEIKQYEIVLRGAVQIAGLNGLFLGVAKERGIDGICLLGEVPSYTTRIPNPKSALAILKVLSEMLHITVDVTDLSVEATKADEEMKRMAAEAMGEFITSYTKPVWPQEEYDEDDDEDEDGDDDDDEEY